MIRLFSVTTALAAPLLSQGTHRSTSELLLAHVSASTPHGTRDLLCSVIVGGEVQQIAVDTSVITSIAMRRRGLCAVAGKGRLQFVETAWPPRGRPGPPAIRTYALVGSRPRFELVAEIPIRADSLVMDLRFGPQGKSMVWREHRMSGGPCSEVWIERSGKAKMLVRFTDRRCPSRPALSPDGTLVAFYLAPTPDDTDPWLSRYGLEVTDLYGNHRALAPPGPRGASGAPMWGRLAAFAPFWTSDSKTIYFPGMPPLDLDVKRFMWGRPVCTYRYDRTTGHAALVSVGSICHLAPDDSSVLLSACPGPKKEKREGFREDWQVETWRVSTRGHEVTPLPHGVHFPRPSLSGEHAVTIHATKEGHAQLRFYGTKTWRVVRQVTLRSSHPGHVKSVENTCWCTVGGTE